MLKVTNLSCGYNKLDVIKNVSFDVNENEMVFILGPNGCGKTTLLKAIDNLIDYKGQISLFKKELKSYKRKELSQKMALLSQNNDMYFDYTVFETVCLGRYPFSKGMLSTISENDKKIALSCMEQTGVEELKNKKITELSGGQLQRVFLAKTFAQQPDLILLDEPTNHLDFRYSIEILEYLKAFSQKKGKAVIGVVHDFLHALQFADKAILLNEGKNIISGNVRDVLESREINDVYGKNIKEYITKSLMLWQ